MIGLAVYGCWLLFQSDRKRSNIAYHLDQLRDDLALPPYAPLLIEDPNRVHVNAIETGKHLEFSWQVYLPLGFKLSPNMEFVNGSQRTSSVVPLIAPSEFIARLKIQLSKEYCVCEYRWQGKTHVCAFDLSQEAKQYLLDFVVDDKVTLTAKDAVQSFPMDDDFDLIQFAVPDTRGNMLGRKPQLLFGLRK
ncbi:MAG: hypothetical protein ABL921_19685 [Pirellula sp.]